MIICHGNGNQHGSYPSSAVGDGPWSDGRIWKMREEKILFWLPCGQRIWRACIVQRRLHIGLGTLTQGWILEEGYGTTMMNTLLKAALRLMNTVSLLFEGGGPERNVLFKWPCYQISTTIPSGIFPGRRSNNALGDIEDEIYSHSGVCDCMKRDALVKAINGSSLSFPIIQDE